MSTTIRFTSADLAGLPKPIDGTRYEIIDGELFVSKQPHWEHQFTNTVFASALHVWSRQTRLGRAVFTPRLVLADEQEVVPDAVWLSHTRYAESLEADGKLHVAPELVIEILSPGSANERRDRGRKLKLYSRIGVEEYWIADWRSRAVEVYRQDNGQLRLIAALNNGDILTSPLVPGFTLPLAELSDAGME